MALATTDIIKVLYTPDYPTPAWAANLDLTTNILVFISFIAAIPALRAIVKATSWTYSMQWISLPLTAAALFAALMLMGDTIRSGLPPDKRLQRRAHFVIALDVASFIREHQGRYPPHLAALILYQPRFASDILEFDGIHTDRLPLPSPTPPISQWPAYAAEVNARSFFIYTAADLTAPALPLTLDHRIIVLYTPPNPLFPNYRILAFADSHSSLIPDAALPKYFAASNAARAKLSLPPFTLDGPPPSPPPSTSHATAIPTPNPTESKPAPSPSG